RVDDAVQLTQSQVGVGRLGEGLQQFGGVGAGRALRLRVPEPQTFGPEQLVGPDAVVGEAVTGEPFHWPSSGSVRPVPDSGMSASGSSPSTRDAKRAANGCHASSTSGRISAVAYMTASASKPRSSR